MQLVIHGLKKRGDLNSALVFCRNGASADGRLSVIRLGETEVETSEGAKTAALVTIGDKAFSIKKENLRHCRPLK